jgi:hypothetical protein
VKTWMHNTILAALGVIAMALASVGVLALMFVGSAFRTSNTTQLDVLSPANLEASMPLFLASATFVFIALLLGVWYGLRKRG